MQTREGSEAFRTRALEILESQELTRGQRNRLASEDGKQEKGTKGKLRAEKPGRNAKAKDTDPSDNRGSTQAHSLP